MIKVFFIGATGHIGGAVIDVISNQLDNVEISALVRDPEKAQRLEQAFPRIKATVGDFKDLDLIEAESKAANIVINTSPDLANGSHEAIRAVLRGLSSRAEKGFCIQTTGAFLIGEETRGETASTKVWSDVADIESIINLSPDRYHQRTDQLIRDASSSVHVALVSPTVVYGLSRSTENQVPITLRDIVGTMKQLHSGFTMSEGKNILSYIHVNDLANIYVKLLADAANGPEQCNNQFWGPEAYYFGSVEELSFAEYMEELVNILKKMDIVSSDVVARIGPASKASMRDLVNRTAVVHGCGANVRCRSHRAVDLLGWQPKERSVMASLPKVVDTLLLRK